MPVLLESDLSKEQVLEVARLLENDENFFLYPVMSSCKAMLDAGGDITVVDVREEAEFCDSTYQPPGHISGAINMPWYSGYLEEHYSDLAPDDTTIVVCRSGARSNAAANFLDGVGFTNVFDMLGGMNAWEWETEECPAASIPERDISLPSALLLGPPTPNPFSLQTEIAYAIPVGHGPKRVSLSVYDAHGRLVASLSKDNQGPGIHHVTWNGTDRRGQPVPSGVYFYRLTWNGRSKTHSVVLLR